MKNFFFKKKVVPLFLSLPQGGEKSSVSTTTTINFLFFFLEFFLKDGEGRGVEESFFYDRVVQQQFRGHFCT